MLSSQVTGKFSADGQTGRWIWYNNMSINAGHKNLLSSRGDNPLNHRE